ncbi:unnamed protein product [Mytilus coruscus]|uniref:B box-type domain-containing protein n=1 Tax=Mytilus coruscus TaxID=42192 RepID=A0A6J8F0N2_MYTCO|nr:unnamed protein product [Mytilus coruscus]
MMTDLRTDFKRVRTQFESDSILNQKQIDLIHVKQKNETAAINGQNKTISNLEKELRDLKQFLHVRNPLMKDDGSSNGEIDPGIAEDSFRSDGVEVFAVGIGKLHLNEDIRNNPASYQVMSKLIVHVCIYTTDNKLTCIHRRMATNSTTSICGICDFRQVTKPSVIWCSECDEGLCKDCTEHHSISKATRGHSAVSIDKYKKLPPSILAITQTCKSHNEKFHLYCHKHDCPCCKKCIVETHNECKELFDIDDVVKDVKSSNAFVDIELTLAEISENLKRIRKDREQNLTSIKETREKIDSEIKMTKLKIVSYLDKLQEKILKKLNKTEKSESIRIHKLLTAVQQADKDVTEYQNNIANIKQHASDLQAFIALKQIEHDVDEKDKFIQTLVNSKDLNQAVLSWKISSDVKNVNTSISTFGEIVVESKSSDITIARRKNKQAQTMVSNPVLKTVNTGDELMNSKRIKINHDNCKQS